MAKYYRTYPGRYYILACVSFFAAHQNVAWATFGPIAEEAMNYYGLGYTQVTLLPAYSPMLFVLLTLPFVWFLKKFGLRIVSISGAWILAVGCSIRLLVPYAPNAPNASEPSEWIWIMHFGHILIGYAGLPAMILPPKVSSVWFPPRERVFATAVAVAFQGVGAALGFIITPYLTQQYSISTMLVVHAELSLFIALLFSIYFPSRPPLPPCASAEKDRTDFMISLKNMLTNHPFIILVASGGILMGGSFGFQSVLSVILNSHSGFNNKVKVHSVAEFLRSTSWLGAVSAILGSISGQITGLLADRFQRKFKLILLTLTSLTTISITWFALSVYGWGSTNPINLFISFTLFYIFSFASMPIYYEAAVEATYPIAEGTSGGLLTLSCNIANLIFSLIGLAGVLSENYPERAKAMVWTTSGLSALSMFLIVCYFERYKRLNTDMMSSQVNEYKIIS